MTHIAQHQQSTIISDFQLDLRHTSFLNLISTGETHAKVHLFQLFNLKGETNILYRLITCKVLYVKPLFVIILMIMAYSL